MSVHVYTAVCCCLIAEDSEGDENRDSGEEGEDGAEGHPHEEEEEEEEEEELTHNFFNLLLAKLLSFHEASSKAVRFASRLLNAVIMQYQRVCDCRQHCFGL